MAMNRRNVLIGLGVVAAGGGAALGTGAFSQVTAERTVTVAAANDTQANVQPSVDGSNSSALADSGGETIQLDAENINLDAVTKVDEAFSVSIANSAEENTTYTVDLYESTSASSSITSTSVDNSSSGNTLQFIFNDSASDGTAGASGGVNGLSPGDSATWDIVINTIDTESASNVSNPYSGAIAVQAVQE